MQTGLCNVEWLSANHVVSLPCFLLGKRKRGEYLLPAGLESKNPNERLRERKNEVCLKERQQKEAQGACGSV